MSDTVTSNQKHGVPALLSFFIPGLGQIIKGQVGKGILIFFSVSLGMLLVVPGIIIWIWQIADAYNN
jgi:TM2 domain-containing membrane protein YozV